MWLIYENPIEISGNESNTLTNIYRDGDIDKTYATEYQPLYIDGHIAKSESATELNALVHIYISMHASFIRTYDFVYTVKLMRQNKYKQNCIPSNQALANAPASSCCQISLFSSTSNYFWYSTVCVCLFVCAK